MSDVAVPDPHGVPLQAANIASIAATADLDLARRGHAGTIKESSNKPRHIGPRRRRHSLRTPVPRTASLTQSKLHRLHRGRMERRTRGPTGSGPAPLTSEPFQQQANNLDTFFRFEIDPRVQVRDPRRPHPHGVAGPRRVPCLQQHRPPGRKPSAETRGREYDVWKSQARTRRQARRPRERVPPPARLSTTPSAQQLRQLVAAERVIVAEKRARAQDARRTLRSPRRRWRVSGLPFFHPESRDRS